MFDPESFFDLVDPDKNVIVAFSGGGDSSALLHFCYKLSLEEHFHARLSAIHVNHSLNKNSDLWEDHCRKFCKDRNINFQSHVVDINTKKSGLESAARNARYSIFKTVLKKNDQLLMAHHADDVAETVLYRLFRGTGLDGLEGPVKKRTLGKGTILRPWLGYTKAQLTEYLSFHNIDFVTDNSNFEANQDRNFIRNEVLKTTLNRWPNASTQIQKTADLVAKHKLSHNYLIEKQFGVNINGSKLERKILLDLDKEICIEIIRFWIKANNLAMPNKKIIGEILKAFIFSNPTSKTQVKWSRADNDQKSAFLTFSDGDLTLNEK